MAVIFEEQHPGEPTWLWKIGNSTAIDSDDVESIGLAWGFKENGVWNFVPRMTENVSLFYNALFFIRFTFSPVTIFAQLLIICTIILGNLSLWWSLTLLLTGVFWSVRWNDSTTSKSLFQTGFGYKLNGRFGALFRIQSDKTSAEGVTGPNYGQAQGFEYGTH